MESQNSGLTDFCLLIYCLQLHFLEKEKKTNKQNLSHFENENTFQKRKMRAHSETHIENENMFFGN